MAEQDAIRGIQAAAFAIYDQRTRLNAAQVALEAALQALKPGCKLMGNGAIIDPSLPQGQQTIAYLPMQPQGTPTAESFHPTQVPDGESDESPPVDHEHNRNMVAA